MNRVNVPKSKLGQLLCRHKHKGWYIKQETYSCISGERRFLVLEPKWIPCSERLPGEDTDVLVTLKCGLIGIMQKKLADDDNGEPCYIWQDFEGEEHEVIAWLPLPEPYREVVEE